MKKYATLSKDLTTFLSEVNAHLATKDINSFGYTSQLYHRIGSAEELVDDIPSITTAFADENLTIAGLGHWNIDHVVRSIPSKLAMLIIPLENTDSCSFLITEPKAEALSYEDTVTGLDFYPMIDCNVVEEVAIGSDSIFVDLGTQYAIKNDSSGLAGFLVVRFNEDLSSYFTE